MAGNKDIFANNKRYFAFNIWDTDSIQAVIDAGYEYKKDVILQTSNRVFSDMDKEAVRRYVDYYQSKKGIKAYLHLDHCRDIGTIQSAIEYGWDSVMIDASHLPLEENIFLSNEVCRYAHSEGVIVEAEVGQIPGVEDYISGTAAGYAKIDDIKKFLENTSVDIFAASVGTCHGLYKEKPDIDHELIDDIAEYCEIPFVVHGGSGLSEIELKRLLVHKNVRKINISTELKQSYRRGILNASKKGLLSENGFEATAVKKEIYKEIKFTAKEKLLLL